MGSFPTRWPALCLVLLLGGCQQFYPVRENMDEATRQAAARLVDLQPLSHLELALPRPDERKAWPKEPEGGPGQEERPPMGRMGRTWAPPPDGLLPAGHVARRQEDEEKPKAPALELPPGLPGGDATPLPRLPAAEKEAERRRAVEKVYPRLPPPTAAPAWPPGPLGLPLTLADLQILAQTNSPALRQAAADVEAARGEAVQAGLPPNPTAGYQADQIRQADTAGLQGVFFDQTIKTAGKLKLAQARAALEQRNAELAFHRARFELFTQVRTGYVNVLAAREGVRVAHALVEFTDRVYRTQVDRLVAGQAATYEPSQLRVLTVQARNALVQARNREVAAWKALAATMGVPAMPPTHVAGRIDMPLPDYRYDGALARALTGHTDVFTAQTAVERDKVALRLAQVQPIPDVNVGLVV